MNCDEFDYMDASIYENCLLNCSTDQFNNLELGNNLRIFSQNILSFNRNFDSFSALLQQLECEIDIIILTETWISFAHYREINGYIGHHSFRSDRRGGGCSVYVRNELRSFLLPDFTISNVDIESVGVFVKGTKFELLVVGIYRPPHCSLIEFNIKLNEFLNATTPSKSCLLYTSPSPRDKRQSRMPSSA